MIGLRFTRREVEFLGWTKTKRSKTKITASRTNWNRNCLFNYNQTITA